MIYLLTRKDELGYDEYIAKVIRASCEMEAREIANEDTGDEGQIWMDPAKVRSKEINQIGPKGEILGSFNAG